MLMEYFPFFISLLKEKKLNKYENVKYKGKPRKIVIESISYKFTGVTL